MDWTWLGPVLSLSGALSGGLLAAWFTSRREERRLVREQVRVARTAVERCAASQLGPDVIAYPGDDPQLIAEIRRNRWQIFFDLYFDSNFEAKAGLGAVRHLDTEMSTVLDESTSWRLEASEIAILRNALNRIEQRHP